MLNGIDIKLNLNEVSLYVVITIIATIFSLFSIVYNVNYINYGFITFVYGVVAQIWELTFKHIITKEKEKKYWILFFGHFILIALWVYIVFNIIKK